MVQPGPKIAPARRRVGAAKVLGEPFSSSGRGPPDHEQFMEIERTDYRAIWLIIETKNASATIDVVLVQLISTCGQP
jgi:hypothetical protein